MEHRSLTLTTILHQQEIHDQVNHMSQTNHLNYMKTYKRKPNVLLILSILVGIGVVLTMLAQSGVQSQVTVNKNENTAVYNNNGWSKMNNPVTVTEQITLTNR